MNKDITWGDVCFEQALDHFNLHEESCAMLFILLTLK